MILFILVGAVLGAFSVVFVLQNITPITVTFLSWQIQGSLAVILFLALIVGMVITLLMVLPGLIRDEWRYSQLKKEKKQVEDELTTTRKVINDVATRPVVVEQPQVLL
jgi:uncharacterized integral membrane protein